MTLNFYTNPNISLWHLVDSCSQWDYYVGKHALRWLKEQTSFTSNDSENLEKYKEIRSKLGWGEETNLFRWAYNGFPNKAKYSELKPRIDHFRNRKLSTSDLTLIEFFENHSQIAENFVQKLKSLYPQNKVKIEKLSLLFPSDQKIVDCFLPYSSVTTGSQGGANGDGIYTEVSESKDFIDSQVVFEHEALHKLTEIPEYLYKKDGNFWKQTDSYLIQNRAMAVNEIFAYAADLVIHQTNLEEQLKYAHSQDKKELVFIWEVAAQIAPIMKHYLSDSLSLKEAQQNILATCRASFSEKV